MKLMKHPKFLLIKWKGSNFTKPMQKTSFDQRDNKHIGKEKNRLKGDSGILLNKVKIYNVTR